MPIRECAKLAQAAPDRIPKRMSPVEIARARPIRNAMIF
jgi:hypothetical protein